MKLEKIFGNPILSPNHKQPWESLVVCNPGVIYDDGTFKMLYRAAGIVLTGLNLLFVHESRL